ncbi:MAG TPA: MMPL family transporter, partial [Actinomycetota bacterium]|nr:MMPL family transporter [Actinomycetota bacterium]
MARVSLPERLARASAGRPWTTVGAWVLVLVAGTFVTSKLLSGVLTNEVEFKDKPESVRAQALVEDRLRETPVTELFIVRSDGLRFSHPDFRAKMQSLQADVTALGPDVVRSAVTFFDTGDRSLISLDEQAMMMPVVLTGTIDEAAEHADEIRAVAHRATADPEFRVLVTGGATMFEDFTTMADEDLARGETFGIVAALIILVLVFGAVVAAVLPIGLGIAAILLAVATVALVGQAFDFTFFVVNMITMMGLAVGIDYSLFIVSRYREERESGAEKLEAVALAARTASRAVLFSGMTVVLALAGMLIIPTSVFQSVSLGAIFAVVFAVAASLTLLPAILSLLGDRVNALRIHRRRGATGGHRFWDWAARRVMARPVVSLVLSAGLLMGAGAFYFGMDIGFSGVSTMPAEMESRQAFEELAANFAGGATAPMEIVVAADDVMAPEIQLGIQDLRDRLADDPGFGPSAVEINEAQTLALVSAPVAGDPSSEAAMASVGRIRDVYVPQA